ncbi:hypothetical protein COCMIDRAFT_243 [Bipolaris oryzae ATCC 44560]|uniref:Uncharacterized protein n=1 Tax=Bipolaris oryzae ATCC 44560 TaxID=930090 RepID=W6ZLS2_COCMI|nr:uncharacterized protein COCMIDRAFT_243 [Bipolaris oryzae ATCC 44560]EUC51020.1 hypothetical protein COCMIDRAFT_243 [Bipolaris oryzae ATCC 44560]
MSISQPQVAPPATGAPAASSNPQDYISQSPVIPSESVTRPSANTNANVNQDTPIVPAGTPSPDPNTIPTAAAADEPLSLNDKLNAGDRYWKFKFAIMTVIIITGLVGIGCFAWLMTTRTGVSDYYILDSYWALWPSLISWSISIAWCLICIIVFIVRKRTVHPGVRVSMELLLWLAFIVTALFALLSLQNIMDYGIYGGPDEWGYDYSSSSSHGDYVLAANNTWVWQEDTSYITSPRDCTSRYSVFSEMNFKDCAEQDAFVNKLWAEKPQRARVNLTGVVCQFFGLVLHFVLFVWACVDTHRRNRTKVSKDAEKLAAGIVQTMIGNGAIIPPPGQAHVQPSMGQRMYYQVPPQGYTVQHMYMQQAPGQQQFATPQQMGQQGYMVPMQYHSGQQGANAPGVGIAGPSSEKGTGPRYA